MALVGHKVDQVLLISSCEEGYRLVKSDLKFVIPKSGWGVLHRINITLKSQLSRIHSGVGQGISQK